MKFSIIMSCFNSVQLESKVLQGGEDKTWTPLLDRVHGPLVWMWSIDPHFLFTRKIKQLNKKNTKKDRH